ncbi:MAG: TlyA family RNA methyltransferase [Candidatus Nitrohelix vancouverensis]|uniref:TlyA family RNA methyltransferase n=1 Tax=Candidatus Nitrohelix vancouverensis TaxID=2705534 RepID=A0A7T0G4V6_9BACT|nr:MAG: TlyA family RNA methyltransferase [Candidatus Nitrohelix vancouverensis]
MILAGKVRCEGQVADKPGRNVSEDALVEVIEALHPYVGRGGLKLEKALDQFNVSPQNKFAVDIGASTGGFTDCLLQRGARRVCAVDVGYGQLAWKLQSDPRVQMLDRTNARALTVEQIGEPADLAVIDVSFISLQLILPAVWRTLDPEGDILALVKPQFEVGKDEVEHQGIIKDTGKHKKVLEVLQAFVEKNGWVICGLTRSPITGQKGNKEFLIHCVRAGRAEAISSNAILEAVSSE